MAFHDEHHFFWFSVAPVLNILENLDELPPTYNRTNKFTRVFQDIVDAYACASYQEISPGWWRSSIGQKYCRRFFVPFEIVTFPFLFAVMFGDAGHGILLALAGAALVFYEKRIKAAKIKNELFTILFDGRYLILMR